MIEYSVLICCSFIFLRIKFGDQESLIALVIFFAFKIRACVLSKHLKQSDSNILFRFIICFRSLFKDPLNASEFVKNLGNSQFLSLRLRG